MTLVSRLAEEDAVTAAGCTCFVVVVVVVQVVISGAEDAVATVEARATASRTARRCVRLTVSAPFHCSLLQPAREKFAMELQTVPLQALALPVLSNVTAQAHNGSVAGDVSRLLAEQV